MINQAIAEQSPIESSAGSEYGVLRARAGERWHVLHVRSRQEKALCEEMALRQIQCYLPLVQHTRFYGHRKARVQIPLFSGYVFLLGSIDQAYSADRTGRVARIIPVFNQEQMDWELANLQLAMMRQPELAAYPFLKKGLRVEVIGGAFRGVQGVIEDRAKDARLILQVTTLGKAVSLEIDASLVSVIN
jgi:transcription termination/antitermination protein NusG